jgi:hypothetical protein
MAQQNMNMNNLLLFQQLLNTSLPMANGNPLGHASLTSFSSANDVPVGTHPSGTNATASSTNPITMSPLMQQKSPDQHALANATNAANLLQLFLNLNSMNQVKSNENDEDPSSSISPARMTAKTTSTAISSPNSAKNPINVPLRQAANTAAVVTASLNQLNMASNDTTTNSSGFSTTVGQLNPTQPTTNPSQNLHNLSALLQLAQRPSKF